MRSFFHRLDDVLRTEDVANVNQAQMNALATKITNTKSAAPTPTVNKAADSQADSLHQQYEQAASTMKKDEQSAALKSDDPAAFKTAANSRKKATDLANAEQAQRAKALGKQKPTDQNVPPELLTT